jgi:hypothetical protein
MAKRTPNNDVRTSEEIVHRTDSLGVEFLKRVRDVIWNRKFFVTELAGSGTEGRLGLAPNNAKEGDIVCIFLWMQCSSAHSEDQKDRRI